MLHYFVTLALKFVMRVLKNAKSTLNMEWSTASVVQKHVAIVLKNAARWRALMLRGDEAPVIKTGAYLIS